MSRVASRIINKTPGKPIGTTNFMGKCEHGYWPRKKKGKRHVKRSKANERFIWLASSRGRSYLVSGEVR